MKKKKAAALAPPPAAPGCGYPFPEEIEAAQGAVPSASWFAPPFPLGTPSLCIAAEECEEQKSRDEINP